MQMEQPLPNFSIFYNLNTNIISAFKLASYSYFSYEAKIKILEQKVDFCEQSNKLNRRYFKKFVNSIKKNTNRNIVHLKPIGGSAGARTPMQIKFGKGVRHPRPN